jgi:nucleotide-binding universal stress UspA family protein
LGEFAMTIHYQRILVPLDGSERAAAALAHGEALAKLTGAQLTLLQVVPSAAMLISDAAVRTPGMGLGTVDPFLNSNQFEEVEAALTEEATNTLNTAAATLTAAGVKVDTVILQSHPADGILNYADEKGIDLIVMSTHGRTGLARLVFGSVAESVLRHATCPVLLIRVAGE